MAVGMDDFYALIAPLDDCQTAQEAFDCLTDAMGQYGFTYVYAGRGIIELSDENGPTQFYYSKGIHDFLMRYIEKRYMYVDPVIAHLAKTKRPFRWRESHIDLTEEQEQQVADARNHGLCYGLILSVVTTPGIHAVVSMGRETDFELTPRQVIEIELLCIVAFAAIDKLVQEAKPAQHSLSAKEHEVLSLVALGKTNWEIGQIMSISEYSVRDYLKVLSDRLETSNRTHTVVRAIQLNLILA